MTLGFHKVIEIEEAANILELKKLNATTDKKTFDIKIVNDFGYPIKVRCPEAINYPVWRKMGVSLNCH